MIEAFGPALAELRQSAGLSLRQLAVEALYSRSYLHDLEHGKKKPRAELAERLDLVLNSGGRLVALVTTGDDMDRRQLLRLALTVPALGPLEAVRQRLDAALGTGVSASTLDHWQEVAAAHAGAYLTTPAAVMVDQLAPDLDEIAELAGAHPHHRDIARVAAQLAGLTGAVCTDLGALHPAKHWLHTSQLYAEASGDSALTSWVVAARAITAYYYGTPTQVLRIADSGIPALGKTAAPGGPMLHGLRARALADLHRPDEARAALAEAQAVFARMGPDDDPMFGYPQRQIHWLSSAVYTKVGDLDQANEQRVEAQRLYPAEDMIDRTLLAFDYADVLRQAGEVEGAAMAARDTILELPAERRVDVILQRARTLSGQLAPHRSLAAVRELEELLAA
jgi:transcriptional regulator with XRE-family HTH domain